MSENAPESRPAMRHILLITAESEGVDVDYEIVHPGCPFEDVPFGFDDSDMPAVREYNCDIGIALRTSGLDDLDPSWQTLSPGRYILDEWHEHTPSLPTNGGEEWDRGLQLGPRLPDECSVDACTADPVEVVETKIETPWFDGVIDMMFGLCPTHFEMFTSGATEAISMREGPGA